jgi:hypothetical protein
MLGPGPGGVGEVGSHVDTEADPAQALGNHRRKL